MVLTCVGLAMPKGVGVQAIVYVGVAFVGIKPKPKFSAFTVPVQVVCVAVGEAEGWGLTVRFVTDVCVTTAFEAFVPVKKAV